MIGMIWELMPLRKVQTQRVKTKCCPNALNHGDAKSLGWGHEKSSEETGLAISKIKGLQRF